MTRPRLPASDPRTLARDIPGLFNSLFPLLVPGLVVHLNRLGRDVAGCAAVPQETVNASEIPRAMLFEIAIAATEQLLVSAGRPLQWNSCIATAAARQRRHFDAEVPESIAEHDKDIAFTVATNLITFLDQLQIEDTAETVHKSPMVPGFQWIASTVGDFALGTRLIEVKCTNRLFTSADYRQVLIYWLLGYASAIESGSPEWSEAILVNPRLNFVVRVPFDMLVRTTGGGRSKVELLEVFSALVGERGVRFGA
jgi:hypothetical protein